MVDDKWTGYRGVGLCFVEGGFPSGAHFVDCLADFGGVFLDFEHHGDHEGQSEGVWRVVVQYDVVAEPVEDVVLSGEFHVLLDVAPLSSDVVAEQFAARGDEGIEELRDEGACRDAKEGAMGGGGDGVVDVGASGRGVGEDALDVAAAATEPSAAVEGAVAKADGPEGAVNIAGIPGVEEVGGAVVDCGVESFADSDDVEEDLDLIAGFVGGTSFERGTPKGGDPGVARERKLRVVRKCSGAFEDARAERNDGVLVDATPGEDGPVFESLIAEFLKRPATCAAFDERGGGAGGKIVNHFLDDAWNDGFVAKGIDDEGHLEVVHAAAAEVVEGLCFGVDDGEGVGVLDDLAESLEAAHPEQSGALQRPADEACAEVEPGGEVRPLLRLGVGGGRGTAGPTEANVGGDQFERIARRRG